MSRVFINTKAVADEHCFLVQRFFEKNAELLMQVAEVILRALQSGNKVLLFGNGGSAADAQHLAAEFVGRFQMDRPGLPALALTTDSSVLTSLANDYGYEFIFARQIEAIGSKGDVAIAISTSGRSANIREGILAAKAKGMVTIGFLGKEGGPVREMVDHPLVVDAQKTARVQEVHILAGHVICDAVEQGLFLRHS